ncbi:MAG: carboxypeptidase-like regulatory domain-containing protein, partial [Spirochaetia bacterium]|nr:carboxypeptidase-like regulatory domain-containing protein [Spirochaetia bacterium]
SFTKSLGFKTGRKKEFGSVQGYVVSENGEPGEGVLLRLGDYAAVSDSKGSFYFPAIPTGRAQLTIDQESMGASFRPRQEMPLTLDILPAETKQVKIEFIKSARIEGRVIENTLLSSFSVVQKSLAANSQKEQSYVSVPGKFRKILLTNGFVTRWTITDSRGAFNFGDLPSGRWVLHVPELEDQGSFRLDNFVLNHEKTNLTDNSLLFFPDEQKGKGLATLNINEGDSIQIELSHLPPIPRVKMIESGSLISVGR